jgi:hypothetical protein
MKLLKEKTEKYIISCKLYKSDKNKVAIEKFKSIIDVTNKTLQKQTTFETNNIFLVVNKLDEFDTFISDFSKSIKNTEDISVLNDRHIAFFDMQQKLETYLKENFYEPKSIELT